MYNERLTEALAVVDCIDPVSQAAGSVNGDVIDMQLHRRVAFIVLAGVLGAAATVDFAVYGDTASGGSFTTMITGKAITQLTKAGSDDNKQVLVEVTAEEAAAQGFRYLRGKATVGTAASLIAVVTLADFSRYAPASDYDLTSVDEIVA